MRPICTVVVDGLPSESSSSSYPGPVSVSEMSLLHALGPVQTWLGQELEKCGIDAMIYTRYVLSLLLHDSYDYDLQEQVFTYFRCCPVKVSFVSVMFCVLYLGMAQVVGGGCLSVCGWKGGMYSTGVKFRLMSLVFFISNCINVLALL